MPVLGDVDPQHSTPSTRSSRRYTILAPTGQAAVLVSASEQAGHRPRRRPTPRADAARPGRHVAPSRAALARERRPTAGARRPAPGGAAETSPGTLAGNGAVSQDAGRPVYMSPPRRRSRRSSAIQTAITVQPTASILAGRVGHGRAGRRGRAAGSPPQPAAGLPQGNTRCDI